MAMPVTTHQWLTVAEVCAKLRISRTTLYRLVRRGIVPAPIELAPAMKRWKDSDLEARGELLRAAPAAELRVLA